MSEASLFIDFDGTISPVDISNAFFTRYSTPDAAHAVEEWKDGLISSTECLRRELDAYKGDIRLLAEFAARQKIDEGFFRLKEECERRGIAIYIVSDGLDYYIRPFLEKHGVNENLLTNCMDVSRGRPELRFPHFNEACGRCANCKSSHVKAEKDKGKLVIYIGDGLSDKCAASLADVVFAKRDLAGYCDENGIAYTPFDGLYEVAASIRSLDLASLAKPE
jgi:2-hydroxy-3-keto-5-methylthiopentenyl-1-phosphate phosphatase